MTRTISIYVLTASFVLLAACTHHKPTKSDGPITSLLGNGALLAVGADFSTGKPVAVETISGKEIQPCPTESTRTRYQSQSKPPIPSSPKGCENKIIQRDGKTYVIDETGKEILADYNITFSLTGYQGTYCVTAAVVGGVSYTGCYTREQICAALNSDPAAKQRYINFYDSKC